MESYIHLDRLQVFRDYIKNILPKTWKNTEKNGSWMKSDPLTEYVKLKRRKKYPCKPATSIKWEVEALCINLMVIEPNSHESWIDYCKRFFLPSGSSTVVYEYIFSCEYYYRNEFSKKELLARIDDVLNVRKSTINRDIIIHHIDCNDTERVLSSGSIAAITENTIEYNSIIEDLITKI